MAAGGLILTGCDVSPPPPDVPGGEPPGGIDALSEGPPGHGSVDPGTVSDALRGELERLLAGPGVPDSQGTPRSWFSEATAGALRSAVVDSAGYAVVDFHDLRPLIPNASSSAGSAALLSELNAAVFRIPEVVSVEYRMEGSCPLFWEWLQYGCQTVNRTG